MSAAPCAAFPALDCANRAPSGATRNADACAACDRDIHDLAWILSLRIQPDIHTDARAGILEDSLRQETGIPIPLAARWMLETGRRLDSAP